MSQQMVVFDRFGLFVALCMGYMMGRLRILLQHQHHRDRVCRTRQA